MKLITTAHELENDFRRLTRKYATFYWATAWASSTSTLFQDLLTNKRKIKKVVVGIHFYQTHPDFIQAFLNDKKVHFIQQPEGTFHPKLYLFTDDSEQQWELIIGSANFTNEAFSKNTEASLLLSNKDNNSKEIFKNAKMLVEDSFNQGKTFNKSDLNKYLITWKNQRQKIQSLSGKYGSTKRTPKPIYEVAMINRGWKEFIKMVRSERFHGVKKRLQVIEISRKLFEKEDHFNNLKEDERKFISGIPNNLNVNGADWGYFGSMKGSGVFQNKIKQNDKNISKALDQIPLSGQITKTHYENFIKYYSKVFKGNYIGTATRLLCMKRPDTFICFDSKNRKALCKDFGIIQSEMDYKRYWDDIIERIYDSNWWQNPTPENKTDEKVNDARAAFLDSLYYEV
jgi:HKD family nuclease